MVGSGKGAVYRRGSKGGLQAAALRKARAKEFQRGQSLGLAWRRVGPKFSSTARPGFDDVPEKNPMPGSATFLWSP